MLSHIMSNARSNESISIPSRFRGELKITQAPYDPLKKRTVIVKSKSMSNFLPVDVVKTEFKKFKSEEILNKRTRFRMASLNMDLSSQSSNKSSASIKVASPKFKRKSRKNSQYSIKLDVNNEYMNYLLSKKMSSDNFIVKMESKDIVWKTEEQEYKKVGSYVFHEELGHGAFAKVKSAICSETLQIVAIKIFSYKKLKKMTGALENVQKEISILRKLKHPNIIRLIDVYAKINPEDPKIVPHHKSLQFVTKQYAIFEYCTISLQTMLDRSPNGRLPLSQAQSYFQQLMDGINYLHRLGIVHRDIKPPNIMLRPDNVLKIVDFGIAEIASPYEQTPQFTTFSGTHQFMAPESLDENTKFVGFEVDIWACGVILYAMILGNFPFEIEDNDVAKLYETIKHQKAFIPEELPYNLRKLVIGILKFNLDLLQKNPQRRPSARKVLEYAWFKEEINKWQSEIPPFRARKARPHIPYSLYKMLRNMFPNDFVGFEALPLFSDTCMPGVTENEVIRSSLDSLNGDDSNEDKKGTISRNNTSTLQRPDSVNKATSPSVSKGTSLSRFGSLRRKPSTRK